MVVKYFGLQEMLEKLQKERKIEVKSNTLFVTYTLDNSHKLLFKCGYNYGKLCVHIEGVESLDKKTSGEDQSPA